MTDLQRFILGHLVGDRRVDGDGGRCGYGLTAREIAGNADHPPRPAWARLCTDLPHEVPVSGPGRQWVATAAGADALAGGTA